MARDRTARINSFKRSSRINISFYFDWSFTSPISKNKSKKILRRFRPLALFNICSSYDFWCTSAIKDVSKVAF